MNTPPKHIKQSSVLIPVFAVIVSLFILGACSKGSNDIPEKGTEHENTMYHMWHHRDNSEVLYPLDKDVNDKKNKAMLSINYDKKNGELNGIYIEPNGNPGVALGNTKKIYIFFLDKKGEVIHAHKFEVGFKPSQNAFFIFEQRKFLAMVEDSVTMGATYPMEDGTEQAIFFRTYMYNHQ